MGNGSPRVDLRCTACHRVFRRAPNSAMTWATDDEQHALADWLSERWTWEPCPERVLESDAVAKLWLKDIAPDSHLDEVAIGRWIVEALLAAALGEELSRVVWKKDFDVPYGPGVHKIEESYHKIRISLNDGGTVLERFTESEITDAPLSEEVRSAIDGRLRTKIFGRPDAKPAGEKQRIGFV